jgi:hypothetical protein
MGQIPKDKVGVVSLLKNSKGSVVFQNNLLKQVVRIGQFLVNLRVVSIDSLKSMRSFWPKQCYTLIKNRKTARVAREKSKLNALNVTQNADTTKNKVGRPRIL